MDFITVTPENLEQEHICCAISNNKDCQVASKKAWMAERFADGLVFRKADARGKCFIEYLPAERAWAPIEAPGYLHIDCFWVSGQLKGHGYADELLDSCIEDARAQGKAGLTVLSSAKKQPFLSDPAYLRKRGFRTADTAAPGYELLYLPLADAADAAELPRFKSHVKEPRTDDAGFALYYSPQCPFTAKYVPLVADVAAARGVPFKTILLETAEQAQNAPAPFTAYSLFHDGVLLTHEILSPKKFEKLLDERGL